MTRTESVIVELPGNAQFLSDQVLLAGSADGKKESMKTEPRCNGEVNKLGNPGFVTSLILDEIESNPIDVITVICKDSEELRVSTLLLASISPYLASLFKNVIYEHVSVDMLLVLPDVEKSAMVQILNIALKGKNATVPNSADILGVLDGILWKLNGHVKQEVDEIMDIDNLSSSVFCELNYQKTEPLASDNDDNFDNDYNDKNFYPSEHEMKQELKMKMEPKSVKVKKKTTLKKKKSKTVSDKDKLLDDIVDMDANFLAELANDFDFCTAQHNLKIEIENIDNLEDPFLVWSKNHNSNPRMEGPRRNAEGKLVPLICPVCQELFPRHKNRNSRRESIDPKYFTHLREHKYTNYKCSCQNLEIHNDTYNTLHLQLNHWQWKTCEHAECNNKVFQPNDYLVHLRKTHKVKGNLKCVECDQSFTQSKFYWRHMHRFHADDHICDCKDIVFKNSKYRRHHMLSFHKKEMLGCDRCAFLCSNEKVMDDHVKRIHMSVTKKKPALEIICDICGMVFKSKTSVQNHKKSMHDHVLIQCTHCPIQLSAYGLKNHMRQLHNEVVCKICKVKVIGLANHMTTFHSNKAQEYQCEHCPKVFEKKEKLKRHIMSMHLKERPYKCRFGCDIAYNDSCNRNAHEKRRHGRLFERVRKRLPFKVAKVVGKVEKNPGGEMEMQEQHPANLGGY